MRVILALALSASLAVSAGAKKTASPGAEYSAAPDGSTPMTRLSAGALWLNGGLDFPKGCSYHAFVAAQGPRPASKRAVLCGLYGQAETDVLFADGSRFRQVAQKDGSFMRLYSYADGASKTMMYDGGQSIYEYAPASGKAQTYTSDGGAEPPELAASAHPGKDDFVLSRADHCVVELASSVKPPVAVDDGDVVPFESVKRDSAELVIAAKSGSIVRVSCLFGSEPAAEAVTVADFQKRFVNAAGKPLFEVLLAPVKKAPLKP